MNELARVVHALATGQAEIGDPLLAGLSPDARAALRELQFLFQRSPSELAALLSQAPLSTTWYSSPLAIANPAMAR